MEASPQSGRASCVDCAGALIIMRLPSRWRSSRPRHTTRRRLAVALLATVALPGCFDGSAILQAHEEETNLVRLDEVDIGEYRITLPHAPGRAGRGVIDFHVFGQVARRDRDKVASALKFNSAEIRYRVLLLTRGLTQEQLDEPKLATLRTQITKIANASLESKMVRNVGFYRFAFTEM
jgi:hypothetical protein